jgi:hypothetical protein
MKLYTHCHMHTTNAEFSICMFHKYAALARKNSGRWYSVAARENIIAERRFNADMARRYFAEYIRAVDRRES